MARRLQPAGGQPQTFAVGEVVAALSHALDLTEGQPPGHARRSCLVALRLADSSGAATTAASPAIGSHR
jgi:hypothetical protein